MLWGEAARWKKPARTQRQEAVGPVWNGQAGLGQKGGTTGAAVVDMPWDYCKGRALRNLQSTTVTLRPPGRRSQVPATRSVAARKLPPVPGRPARPPGGPP